MTGKPHKCYYCEHSFMTKEERRRHMRQRHRDIVIDPSEGYGDKYVVVETTLEGELLDD